MSLPELPNELLLFTGSYLHEPRDVLSLILTGRRFYHTLITRLHDLAVEDKGGLNALSWAACRGDPHLIRVLLARGFSANFGDGVLDKPPLYLAVDAGNVPSVRLLLEAGADVHLKAMYGVTALHVAAAFKTAEMAEALIDHGASVSVIDQYKSTPLHCAAGCKNAGTLKVMLERGRDIKDCIDLKDFSGETALQAAISMSTHPDSTPPEESIALLLEHGADMEARNYQDQNALILAVMGNMPGVVALLIAHGVKLQPGRMLFTPLQKAAGNLRADIVALLLEAGADAGSRDRDGKTALSWALESVREAQPHDKEKYERIVELLLEAGGQGAFGGWELEESARWAAENRRSGLLRILSEKGAPPSVLVPNGETIAF